MFGNLRTAIAHLLGPNFKTRDLLLLAIGTTAILWYWVGITILGLYPVVAKKPLNEQATDNVKLTQRKITASDVASLRELATTAAAASKAKPSDPQLRKNQDAAQKSLLVAEEALQVQQSELDLWQFMGFSVTTIAGTLATFVGMVLGLGQTVAPGNANVVPPDPNVPVNPPAPASAEITPMQKAAAWAYFGSLVYALVLWGLYTFLVWWDFQIPPLDPAISRLGQSVLGLFGGALAVLLNVK